MNETKSKHNVFVYGTLRPKDKDGNIIPATHRLYGYVMYNYGPFPYIEEALYEDVSVVGNIIEVDDEQLEWLDVYEGTKKQLYKRISEIIHSTETEDVLGAYVYVADKIKTPMIPSGDWANV